MFTLWMNLRTITTTDASSDLQQSSAGAVRSCLLLYVGMNTANFFPSLASLSNSNRAFPNPEV